MAGPSLAHTHSILPLIGSGDNFFTTITEQNVSILEVINAEKGNSPELIEDVLISESLQTQNIFFRSFVEPVIVIADSIEVIPKTIRNLFESVSISETLSKKITSIRTINENTSISEILFAFFGEGRQIIESTITISDSISIRIASNRVITETVAISEALFKRVANTRNIIQNIAVLDFLQKQGDKLKNLVENNPISEILSKTTLTLKSLIENVSISDVLITLVGIFPTKTTTEDLCADTEISSNLCVSDKDETGLCI